MPEERTYTQGEHLAIMADAVAREVSSATAEKDARISELESRVDVLEAEKAAAVAQAAEVQRAFDEFKTEEERKAEVAARRDSRVSAVRAIAAADLPDDYFSEKRITRWAEMADEQFDAFLDDLADTTAASLKPEEASQLTGLEGPARREKLAGILAARKPEGAKAPTSSGPGTTHLIAETAAFTGGQTGGVGDKQKVGGTALRLLRPGAFSKTA